MILGKHTIQRRKDFKAEVFRRCKNKSLFEKNRIYEGIRQIDNALNGKVYNSHRLSIDEYNRLICLLDGILPKETL